MYLGTYTHTGLEGGTLEALQKGSWDVYTTLHYGYGVITVYALLYLGNLGRRGWRGFCPAEGEPYPFVVLFDIVCRYYLGPAGGAGRSEHRLLSKITFSGKLVYLGPYAETALGVI